MWLGFECTIGHYPKRMKILKLNQYINMRYRLGKLSDLNQIVDLHFKVRDTYSVGYFSQMGKSFIKQYYRIVLDDPYEVFICAEDDSGTIRGFCSASLDVVEQFKRMRKHKFRMALSALPSFIVNPKSIRETWKRYNSTKGENDEKFIPKEGPRCEYWTWDSDYKDSASSVALFNIYLSILYQLGVKSLPLDVDIVNENILLFHKLNKAEVVENITLSDGRQRTLLRYDLTARFSKNKK